MSLKDLAKPKLEAAFKKANAGLTDDSDDAAIKAALEKQLGNMVTWTGQAVAQSCAKFAAWRAERDDWFGALRALRCARVRVLCCWRRNNDPPPPFRRDDHRQGQEGGGGSSGWC